MPRRRCSSHPGSSPPTTPTGALSTRRGRSTRGSPSWRRPSASLPDSREARAALAGAYGRSGRAADAERERDALRTLEPKRGIAPHSTLDTRGQPPAEGRAPVTRGSRLAASSPASRPSCSRRPPSPPRPRRPRTSSGATSSASTPRSSSSTSSCATRRDEPSATSGRTRSRCTRTACGRKPEGFRFLDSRAIGETMEDARAEAAAADRRRAAPAAPAPPPPKPGESRHLNLVTLLFDQLGPDGRNIARKAALSFLELENRPDVLRLRVPDRREPAARAPVHERPRVRPQRGPVRDRAAQHAVHERRRPADGVGGARQRAARQPRRDHQRRRRAERRVVGRHARSAGRHGEHDRQRAAHDGHAAARAAGALRAVRGPGAREAAAAARRAQDDPVLLGGCPGPADARARAALGDQRGEPGQRQRLRRRRPRPRHHERHRGGAGDAAGGGGHQHAAADAARVPPLHARGDADRRHGRGQPAHGHDRDAGAARGEHRRHDDRAHERRARRHRASRGRPPRLLRDRLLARRTASSTESSAA